MKAADIYIGKAGGLAVTESLACGLPLPGHEIRVSAERIGADGDVEAIALEALPPELASRIAAWKPDELEYLVQHGIKLTGMPAWPA